jgi:hypothetical protein
MGQGHAAFRQERKRSAHQQQESAQEYAQADEEMSCRLLSLQGISLLQRVSCYVRRYYCGAGSPSG